MPASSAKIKTVNGRKYLQQLCKHFAHKIDVDYSDSKGECRFSYGTVRMEADAGELRFSVTAPDDEQLLQTQKVIESHLATFAFRENIQPLPWSA